MLENDVQLGCNSEYVAEVCIWEGRKLSCWQLSMVGRRRKKLQLLAEAQSQQEMIFSHCTAMTTTASHIQLQDKRAFQVLLNSTSQPQHPVQPQTGWTGHTHNDTDMFTPSSPSTAQGDSKQTPFTLTLPKEGSVSCQGKSFYIYSDTEIH